MDDFSDSASRSDRGEAGCEYVEVGYAAHASVRPTCPIDTLHLLLPHSPPSTAKPFHHNPADVEPFLAAAAEIIIRRQRVPPRQRSEVRALPPALPLLTHH